MKTSSPDLGDFQTPVELVRAILRTLGPIADSAARVLEPACGRGSFLQGLLELDRPAPEVKAFELQPGYLAEARELTGAGRGGRVELRLGSIFKVDLGSLEWKEKGPLLVLGNPPWITSASLGALDSKNLPTKSNVLSLKGLDARTGAANFDLTEYVWWKVLTELASEKPTVALLSKTSVARRVLALARHSRVPLAGVRMYPLDARRWFGASVDACLFIAEVGGDDENYQFSVYDDLGAERPAHRAGYVGRELVANTALYAASAFVEGSTVLRWRQGVKHDAAAVMELRRSGAGFVNGLGEQIDIEGSHVSPLLKGSDLFRGVTTDTTRAAVVTQRRLADDPTRLAQDAPKLWEYLSKHRGRFDRRRSSIYRNRPPFSMFGVGDYSFTPFKVAVAGLYKDAKFRAVGPIRGSAVIFDDTCYFVPVATAPEAALLTALLNCPEARGFIESVVFWDAKRPITKKLLDRLSPVRLLECADRSSVEETALAELEKLQSDADAPDWDSVSETLLYGDHAGQLTLVR